MQNIPVILWQHCNCTTVLTTVWIFIFKANISKCQKLKKDQCTVTYRYVTIFNQQYKHAKGLKTLSKWMNTMKPCHLFLPMSDMMKSIELNLKQKSLQNNNSNTSQLMSGQMDVLSRHSHPVVKACSDWELQFMQGKWEMFWRHRSTGSVSCQLPLTAGSCLVPLQHQAAQPEEAT